MTVRRARAIPGIASEEANLVRCDIDSIEEFAGRAGTTSAILTISQSELNRSGALSPPNRCRGVYEMSRVKYARSVVLALLPALFLSALPVAAQEYFGRNKVQYETFSWKKMPAPHFDVYFYEEEETVARDAARMAERWYTRHSALLSHNFNRFPLIFYADHPDFEQTNVIGGLLGESTGGVTEGLRTRVIMPFTGSYADNDHVLGHEIVHVFQYDIARKPRSGGLQNLMRQPLWLIEGMAEYLSVGRHDPLTAMWLRDAALRNDIPTIRQLTRDTRYFPYRYGQALWAYVGGKWGDQAIAQVFESSLRMGFENAIKRELGISADSLSKEWIAQIRADYLPAMSGRTLPKDAGKLVIGRSDKTGDMNLSPVQSPDGRFVAFFARRDIFTVDLYVAETATGKVVKRLTSPATNPHFDAVSFLYSSGAWSPDSRRIAYIVFAEGDNEIAIADVGSGKVERRIHPEEIDAINTIAWSPDGNSIAIAGTSGGISDLFLYDLRSNTVRRLTNDRYAEMHPAFSPDGRTIAFTTDRGEETSFELMHFGEMRLALIDASGGPVRLLTSIPGAKMINPQWTPDGRELYFVSNRGGFSDIYRMDLASGSLRQVTNLATGISGISANSPAMSVASNGRLMFSVFEDQGYSILALDPGDASGMPVTSPMVTELASGINPGLLPPVVAAARTQVGRMLADPMTGLPATASYPVEKYRPRLTLEALGQPSFGVGTSPYGTQVGGGISASFGDMLGNRQVGVALQAQGELQDIGGQVYYTNSTRRWNYSIYGGHVPYITGYSTVEPTTVNVDGQAFNADLVSQYVQRVFFDQIGFATQYPFSRTRRLEFNLTGNHVGFSTKVNRLLVVGNQIVAEDRADTTSPPGFNFGQGSAALVGDNSFFGFTSPVSGGRWRVEAGPTFGEMNFTTALADFRKYFFLRPVSLAVRALHYGRYGGDAERMQPLHLGQGTLVRGYQASSFQVSECTVTGQKNSCPEFERLIGSKIGVANMELRIPLTGPRELSLIPNNFIPIEISPFVDAGVAWSAGDPFTLDFSRTSTGRVPVVSTGVAMRVNFFGYAVGEVYYAKPFQRNRTSGVFGFNLAPGW
jgi:Tol biopolymer transport system component